MSTAEHIRRIYDKFPDMPQSAIARKVGCGQDHVCHVIKRYVKACSPQELEDFRENKPDILEAVQHKTLVSITDEDMAKASLLQKMTVVAIAEDKIRLMRGQPTSLHVTALMDVAELIRQRRG